MIGYIAIIFYLIITGFFVWIYPGDNILNNGYADLYKLFELGPLVMLLLVPAITMRSFAEEFDSGTIEFLLTKPLSDSDILLGKFFASYSIVIIAILPTTIYIYSVYQLGLPVGNIDKKVHIAWKSGFDKIVVPQYNCNEAMTASLGYGVDVACVATFSQAVQEMIKD